MQEDMFGGRGQRRGCLLLVLGACWWPADQRCVGEPQEQS